MLRRSVLHRQRFAKRHALDDPSVPVAGCPCATCEGRRDDQHYTMVGNVLGLTEHGMCKCGRSLDEQGRCIAGPSCAHFAEQVRR
jgi:hypothetical protein